MAGKQRQSEESKIIAYFRNQPLEVANMVFGLVKEELKQRQPKSTSGTKAAGLGSKPKTKPKDDPRQSEIDKSKYEHVGSSAGAGASS